MVVRSGRRSRSWAPITSTPVAQQSLPGAALTHDGNQHELRQPSRRESSWAQSNIGCARARSFDRQSILMPAYSRSSTRKTVARRIDTAEMVGSDDLHAGRWRCPCWQARNLYQHTRRRLARERMMSENGRKGLNARKSGACKHHAPHDDTGCPQGRRGGDHSPTTTEQRHGTSEQPPAKDVPPTAIATAWQMPTTMAPATSTAMRSAQT